MTSLMRLLSSHEVIGYILAGMCADQDTGTNKGDWCLPVPEVYPCATLKVKVANVLPGNHKVSADATRGVIPGPCNRDLLLLPIVMLSLHLSSITPLQEMLPGLIGIC